MISLIMAVRDNLEYTKKALASVQKNTTIAYEWIIIDNASGQNMRDFLETVNARVVTNGENAGCARAWNQGIRMAKGDFVCILNNDIEVPMGWLKRLQDFYKRHNFAWVSPMLREGALSYDLGCYGGRLASRLNGAYFLDDFCGVALFSEKNLYDKIGLFDENFEMGKYEDEDMFWRIKAAGLETAVTSSVLIHHYGSLTVKQERQKKPDFELRNRAYFKKKWKDIYLKRKLRKYRIALQNWYIRRRYGLLDEVVF